MHSPSARVSRLHRKCSARAPRNRARLAATFLKPMHGNVLSLATQGRIGRAEPATHAAARASVAQLLSSNPRKCMTVAGLTPRPPLILLANEHEWAARSLETILGPHGFAVLRAYTGRQLLGLVRSAQPDLIMVDVRLPDMRGVDVCRALRDDPHFPEETPIIFTSSGTPEREERLEAFQRRRVGGREPAARRRAPAAQARCVHARQARGRPPAR